MRLLRGVPVRLVVIGLPGPVPIRSGSPRGLPVLVHIVARRARGLRLRRARHRLANSADRQCCLPTVRTGSAPGSMFSQLNTLPTGTSVYASPAASRRPAQDSRPGWSRCSFPVGLFHPLQYAGLSRRSLSPGIVELVLRHTAVLRRDQPPRAERVSMLEESRAAAVDIARQ